MYITKMIDNCEHRTLPPKVKGKLHGHLTIIVDEIVWCGKQTENVIVQTKWWGDDKSVIFRPCNIANLIDSKNRNMKVMFDIRTNTALFENYLKNCRHLEFCVIKEDSKELIGRAFLFEPHEIIQKTHFEKYCPVSNPTGVKVCDLHIVLNLWLKQRLPAEKEGENLYSVGSSSSSEEQVRPLHKRRGCKACEKHIKMTSKVSPRKKMKSDTIEEKPLHRSMDASEKSNVVPPNTVRSDHSEALLSDIYERGEKLRKAMVMSILEDCNISNIEQEFNELDRQSKMAVKDEILRNFISQNFSNISSAVTDEVRVMDYLLGKEMSKEDEMKALKALRTISPQPSVLNLGNLEKPDTQANSDEYCLSSGREYLCYAEKSSIQQKFDIPTSHITRSDNVEVLQHKENETRVPEWCKKVNSVQISVELLRLTASGVRKMYNVLQKESKHFRNLTRDLLAPSSVTYFIEAYFTENIDHTTSRTWRHKPNDRFCSRKEAENIVYFGQSCIRHLSTPFSVKSMNSWLMSSQWVVFWRHLNQRVPSSLGSIIMENLPNVPYLENTFTFPVATENTVNGYVRLKIELGKGKRCFGFSLTAEENQPEQPSESTKTTNSTKASLLHESDGVHRIREDAKENIEPTFSSIDKACQSEFEIETLNRQQISRKSSGNFSFSYDNLMPKDLMMCPNCKEYQSVKISEPSKVKYPSVYFPLEKFYSCSMCKTWFTKQHKQDDVLPKLATSDVCVKYRVNEFVVGIENIEDVLFSKESYEDFSCYVDYKFFQTDVPGFVKMSAVDFTSKIVNCSTQTYFSTVHRHCLCLPDSVPLTTMLGSFCPGISFRLWIRRYTPSPRDHMVAMTLLPLDKICSFDWKFDSKNKDDPVIEIFELPLTLVKSLSTLDLVSTEQNTCGKLRVSISYRKYNNETSQVLSHEQMYTEKGEMLINAGQTNDFDNELGSIDKRDCDKVNDRNNYSKQYEENGKNMVYSNIDETVKLRAEGLGDPAERFNKETMKQTDYSDNELRYLRRRFWTGEYERNHYDTSKEPYLGISSCDQVLEINKNPRSNSKVSRKRVEFNSDKDFKKNFQDLTHIPDYRFHDEAHGVDRNYLRDSKYTSRVHFQDSDYDIRNYRLKHRSYDSLTDGLNKLCSEGYPSHMSLREKFDDVHSPRVKHLSYEDIREGSCVNDLKQRPSNKPYNLNTCKLAQKSYESLRDTENFDLTYGTREKQLKVDFTESYVDSSHHRPNERLITSDLRHDSGKNYGRAIDSDVIGCSYKHSSDLVDISKEYTSDSGSKSLPVETANDQICRTYEPLDDVKGSSVDLLKTSDSYIRTNSDADNTVSDITVNSDHVPLTTDKSESTINKNNSQHYNDDMSNYHKMTLDVQDNESTETVEIFTTNKGVFNADRSDDSILQSHVSYTDGKSIDNLCEVEHSVSESKQSSDKLNKSDGSFENESQSIDQNIKLQQLGDNFQDIASSHVSNMVMSLNQASRNSKEYFKAHVEIEQAMHLPMRKRYVNGIQTLTQPSTYVTFKVAGEDRDVLYSTSIIQENCNPVWHESWKVELPVVLLQEVDKRLVFCICEEDMGRDFVLGHAAANLTLFLYGLPFLRSWININDFRATCIGQIKINITPLEDISRYQKNSFMTRDRVQGDYNDSSKFCFSSLPSSTSNSKMILQQSTKCDNGEVECQNSEMNLTEKLIELDCLIQRFEKKLYLSNRSGLSESSRGISRDSFPEIGCNATETFMDTNVTDSDEITQCTRNNDRIQTNVDSVDGIISSTRSEANKNVQENENIEGNVTKTSQYNCDHCSCHCCDISSSDDVRLQYLLNPLVFHHLLANISQIARTEVLTSDAGHQTEFSDSNEELISRPLASGMSAPEEEISKSDIDTSMSELEQFFKSGDKEECQTHRVDEVSEIVKNPFLPSSDNSLLQSETPQLNKENPEGRGNRKKPEKVASRLQRQSTFVIKKKFGYGDDAETHSK